MRSLLVFGVILFAARCATIANGRFQNVNVASDPAGADVRVDCGDLNRDGGKTPTVVKLQRKAASCTITIAKSGFADRVVTFERKTSGWFWGNLASPGLVFEVGVELATGPPLFSVFGGESDRHQVNGVGFIAGTGLGMLLDHTTGAQYEFLPRKVDVKLAPR